MSSLFGAGLLLPGRARVLAMALLLCVTLMPNAVSGQSFNATIYENNALDVKFAEDSKVRARAGKPATLGANRSVRDDLAAIEQVLAGSAWQRLHSVAEKRVDEFRSEALSRSSRVLPNLNLYLRVRLPAHLDPPEAKRILQQYHAVEGAYYVPKPVPPPTAPDYSDPVTDPYQGYLDAAPNGIDARYAWTQGADGTGVRLCDVEYWVNNNHLDLPHVTITGDQPRTTFTDDHGTAVFSIFAGLDDGVGVKGIAHDTAGLYLAAAWTIDGHNIARAILECVAVLSPGDIILIEQQLGDGVPTEWNKAIYDTIVTAVANGIVVVETTGNGGHDLDDAFFSTGNDDHWPFLLENDSGAILTTQGQSPLEATPRAARGSSNYGDTVDLQGWGANIVSAGIGSLYDTDGPNAFYTANFSGSSGAGPMVAGAVAAVQEFYRQTHDGATAPPATIKSILQATGTPHEGAKHIGPLPDLQAAIDSIANTVYVDDNASGNNDGTSWSNAFRELQEGLFAASAGTTVRVAAGMYWPDWDPVSNLVTSDPDDTFQLKNGVAILGGYPNGGGVRDPVANVTLLTGTIGATPSYHVVTGSNTDDSALLDGVTIFGGLADQASPRDVGAGLYVVNGSPTIRGVTFSNNSALSGGAVYTALGSPYFIDVRLIGNSATGLSPAGRGGGMLNSSGEARLNNVTFIGNSATDEGGGFHNAFAGTPFLNNVRFYGNSAFRGGGLSKQDGDIRVDNAIFSGNMASDLGGAAVNFLGTIDFNNVSMTNNDAPAGGALYLFDPVTVENSIVWGNTGMQIQSHGAGSNTAVEDSIVQGGFAGGTGILDADPMFRDADGADDTIGTEDDDLRLDGGVPPNVPPSPAIDAAGPVVNFFSPSDCVGGDIVGAARVGDCDMGAHEYQGDPGSWWSNGEIDKIVVAESYDATALSGPLRQSADDFIVPTGMACDVNTIRAPLRDQTLAKDAVVELRADDGGLPGTLIGTFDNPSVCAHDGSACSEFLDCATATACGTGLPACASGSLCTGAPGSATKFCTYHCGPVGQPLGGHNNIPIFEHEIDMAGTRLAEGTYWVSVFGTREADSPGLVHWPSAGDAGFRSSASQFRQVGFNWTDAAMFFGDDQSRDLALDVDATCGVDSDGDGVQDSVDNCTNISDPDQRDTNADGIGNACDADLNGDCAVNFGDLAVLKSAFVPAPYNEDADFDGDGLVNFGDLVFMKATFFNSASPGPGPGAPGNACE